MSLVPFENIVADAAITHGMRTCTRFTIFGRRDRGVEFQMCLAWRLTMSRIAWTEVSWKPSVGKRLVKSWSYLRSKRQVLPRPSTIVARRGGGGGSPTPGHEAVGVSWVSRPPA